MSAKCPYCSSANISSPQKYAATVSGIGAIGGAAGAIYTAMSSAPKYSPFVFTAATLANLLLIGLTGGLSGSALGAQIGHELDNNLPASYTCNDCEQKFSPVIALN